MTRAQSRTSDSAIADSLKKLRDLPGGQRQAELDRLEGYIQRYDTLARPVVRDQNLQAKVKGIKKNPLYADPAEGQQANWLANSIQKLSDAIRKRIPERRANTLDMPNANLSWLGSAITFLAWGLLALLVAGFVYLIAKHVRWKAKLQRKAKAVLEDDEPERTLDEWLTLADEHEREGRYREAVRCLYLACLLKFDEAGVARFDRGETNWEHLARIEKSPKMPADINFRSPTQHFDRVWYGYILQGMQDVVEFRATYIAVRDMLVARKAA